MTRKIMLLTIFLFTTTTILNNCVEVTAPIIDGTPQMELLYDNVWGSIYHAATEQCDSTPFLTGDGSRINPRHASQYRWIAISHEMLDCAYRASLVSSNNPRYKGKIEYGDTIWIESPHTEINGWWVVHDTKNAKYNKSIDFLQTEGDGTLYNNSKLWSGRFNDIKIYRITNTSHMSTNIAKL